MPIVTELPVQGWASCPDTLCPGYTQERLDIIERTQEFSFMELGGDIPGIERSMIDAVRTVDPDAADCAHCGKPRIVALQERPEYARASGQDPLRLLNLTQDKQFRDMQVEGYKRDAELAEMKAMIAQQAAQITELTARRGPGRPPRDSAA